eukprot:gene24669-10297_t
MASRLIQNSEPVKLKQGVRAKLIQIRAAAAVTPYKSALMSKGPPRAFRGRVKLNQIWLNINREGVFYGQCSELCGANHSFMPIVVEAISPRQFLTEYVRKLIDAA